LFGCFELQAHALRGKLAGGINILTGIGDLYKGDYVTGVQKIARGVVRIIF